MKLREISRWDLRMLVKLNRGMARLSTEDSVLALQEQVGQYSQLPGVGSKQCSPKPQNIHELEKCSRPPRHFALWLGPPQ